MECVYSPSNTILGEHVILKSSISLNLILHFGLPFQQLDESGNVSSSPLRSSREREKRDKNTRVNQRPSIRHLSFHPLALPWWSCFYFGQNDLDLLVLDQEQGKPTGLNPLSLTHTPIPYSIPNILYLQLHTYSPCLNHKRFNQLATHCQRRLHLFTILK